MMDMMKLVFIIMIGKIIMDLVYYLMMHIGHHVLSSELSRVQFLVGLIGEMKMGSEFAGKPALRKIKDFSESLAKSVTNKFVGTNLLLADPETSFPYRCARIVVDRRVMGYTNSLHDMHYVSCLP